MTWTQMARLWNDYGAFITICVVIGVALSVGVALLIKFWPTLTKAVTIGNALAKLPADLTTIHTEIGTLRSNVGGLTTNLGNVTTNLGDVTRNLGDLTTNLAGVTTKLSANGQAFADHLDDAKVKTEMLVAVDGRLDRIEEKAGIAAHQTTNNGGSSMKDAVDRSESRLQRLEAAITAIATQLGHANDVPLTATGSITLTPDGAPTES